MKIVRCLAAVLCAAVIAGNANSFAREAVYVTDVICKDDFSSGKIPNDRYQIGSNNGGKAMIYDCDGSGNYAVAVGAEGATTSIGPMFAIRLFDIQSDVDLEFDILATTTDIDFNLKVYDWAKSTVRYKLNVFQMKNGEVVPTGSGGSADTVSFSENHWYRFKLKLYSGENKYDLYMAEYNDGNLGEYIRLAEGVNSVNAAKVQGFNSFQFCCAATTASGGWVYIDNILCTKQSELPYIDGISQTENNRISVRIGGKLAETELAGKVRVADEFGAVAVESAVYDEETSVILLTTKRSLNPGMPHTVTVDASVKREGGAELGSELGDGFISVQTKTDIFDGNFEETADGTVFNARLENRTEEEKTMILVITGSSGQKAVECVLEPGGTMNVSTPAVAEGEQAYVIDENGNLISSVIRKED